jgi:putative ABC transport system permease protein
MDVFQADHIEVIPLGSMGSSGQMSRMKERISGLPGVAGVSTSSFIPGEEVVSMYEFNVGGPGAGKIVTMRGASADAGFLAAYGIPLVAGRNFSRTPSGLNEDEIIINETAAKALGWYTPVGKTLSRGYLRGVIVGVARNFPVRSLRDSIEPLFLVYLPARDRYLSVRFEPGDHTRTLEHIKRVWRESGREVPYAPFRLSDRLDVLHGLERRMAGLFGAGAALALILACAGIYGLTSCVGERRRVEIGVRKAFGASRAEVFRKLARNPAMMVSAVFVIAVPTALFIAHALFGAYHYRAPIPYYLLASGCMTVAVAAGIAAGYPAFRAASASPSDTLRHE